VCGERTGQAAGAYSLCCWRPSAIGIENLLLLNNLKRANGPVQPAATFSALVEITGLLPGQRRA